jgi:hypothetical protein
MQGQLILGAILTVALSAPAMAVEQPQRQGCSKGEQQQVQQWRQRQQVPQQQQPQARNGQRQGCPISRTIPPVVDPTPTFLL